MAGWAALLFLPDAASAQWVPDGVALPAGGYQASPNIVSDGAGGAIVIWVDSGDIYAQRVNGSGNLLWATGGVAICTAPNTQSYSSIVSDGTGGAIIAW